MSKLKEFHDLEHALKHQQEKLELLARDETLGKLLEFEKKLLALLTRYHLNRQDLNAFIRPVTSHSSEESGPYKAGKKRSSGVPKTR